MARYLSNINLAGNELQNATFHKVLSTSLPASPVDGQLVYVTDTNQVLVYHNSAWHSISGDITSVTAGGGLTGTGTTGDITLDIGEGSGIQVDADEISVKLNALSGLTFDTNGGALVIQPGGTAFSQEVSGSFGVRVDGTSIEADGSNNLSLKVTGVTAGSYGSSTEIPTFTVDADGRLTVAGTASISTTLNVAADTGSGDGVALATDTLTIAGTANEIETSISGDTVTIGLPNDVTIGNNLTVTGNLTVSGTTTTVNTETINLADNVITLNSNATGSASEDAGIEVERGDDTNVSILWNETNDRWTFTNDGSTFYNVATPSDIDQRITDREVAISIGNGTNTSYYVAHNLGTRDVIVQLFDNSTYDTVYADVVRDSVNNVLISFASAPSLNGIRVLITQIG